jgi:hypothetical protein
MDIVIGTHALGLGGSETYALTLAEQLARLGHGVLLCAVGLGDGEVAARERGIEVVALDEYDGRPRDAIIAQDAGMAFELTRRHPSAPMLFVAHSEEFDGQLPPGLSGLVGAVVVLNNRVERRVRALATDMRVVRMRQPIDIARFRPRSRPGREPARLLLFGNNLDGERLALVADVADHAGIDVVRAGARGESTLRPERVIDGADIVMGYGRCALESMACGRPTYVYDHLGGDGWVTPGSYQALERDGFGGRASSDVIDADRLLTDLRRYDGAMGIANRDLVIGRHRAEHHAHEIVALLRSLEPPSHSRADALGELASLVRAQWSARARIDDLEAYVRRLDARVADERAAAAEAWAAHDAVKSTLRYRIGTALARPLDALRGAPRRR